MSLSLVSCLALGLAACVDSPTLGADEGELATDDRATETRPVDPASMASLYYGINPRPHSEKAYAPSDPAPSLAAQPTVVDSSGTVVVLVSTIYNRPPFGRAARVSVCDETGTPLTTTVVTTPGRFDLHDLEPGTPVYIRPQTVGTMAKILTPEQIAAAGF